MSYTDNVRELDPTVSARVVAGLVPPDRFPLLPWRTLWTALTRGWWRWTR